ncbi:hypothetical protein TNCV_3951031 [Trichonephila clavipes]|nr:hypothetical protein TNCV_3951031 [Trichonephila clavipes]
MWSSGCHDFRGMGARPVVKSVSMSVWAPWVPTWVVSIKSPKSMTLGLALRNSIKLRRVNMIPRRLVNARQREEDAHQCQKPSANGDSSGLSPVHYQSCYITGPQKKPGDAISFPQCLCGKQCLQHCPH